MQVIETPVYQYEELSDDAKEKAREWWVSSFDGDNFWAESVEEMAKEAGEMIGIEIKDMYWSIGCHQGAGAMFTGSYSYAKGGAVALKKEWPTSTTLHEIADALQSAQRRHFYKLGANVSHTGHGVHACNANVEVWHDDHSWYLPDAVTDKEDDESIREALRDFMYWIHKSLETEYEYQTSEESCKEACEANEYTFTEEGERFG